MIASLLWKEWRECRWKLLVLFGVYLALVLLAWAVERHVPLAQAQFAVLMLCLLMPGVVAMGTIADERVRRTSETLQSLPISTGWVFFTKTLAGLATLLLPLLAIEAFNFLVLHGDRNYPQNFELFPSAPLAFAGLSVSLYLWILAFAAPRRTELGVAATYVLMFLAFGLITLLLAMLNGLAYYFERYVDFSKIIKPLLLVSPLGFITGITETRPDESPSLGAAALVQFLTWLPLAALALWRYARNPVLRIARPLAHAAGQTTTQLTSRRFPILWKSWREYRAPVLTFSALVLILIIFVSLTNQHALSTGWIAPAVSDLLPIPCLLSMIMVVFLGTDVALSESESHLENFWLSRPIPSSSYFRQRFTFGLLLSLLLVVIPAALSLLIISRQLAAFPHPPRDLIDYVYHRSNVPPSAARPVYPAWPASRDPANVESILHGLSSNYEILSAFLIFCVPLAFFSFSLSAFLASLSRRRIIPLMLSFGLTLAVPVTLLAAVELGMPRHWLESLPFIRVLSVFYGFFMLFLSLLLAYFAAQSTTANWRARLERRLESRSELLPASY